MTTAVAILVAVLLAQQQSSSIPKPGVAGDRLAQMVAASEGPYSKVADGVWTTQYRGKNMASITIKIAGAENGIFFFVDLFQRKSITLSRNALVRIAELNSQLDYVKIALDDNSLQLRADIPAKLLDLAEFKRVESQVAAAADEAYGIIRDFVQ